MSTYPTKPVRLPDFQISRDSETITTEEPAGDLNTLFFDANGDNLSDRIRAITAKDGRSVKLTFNAGCRPRRNSGQFQHRRRPRSADGCLAV